MDVSLIVPSYRRSQRLRGLLTALESQQSTLQWEVVVVLDGPDEASSIVLEEAAKTLPLRVIQFEKNHGRPTALNAGFNAATGRVLVRCDDDLAPGPNYIDRHASWHANAHNVAVIGLTQNVFPDDNVYGRAYGIEADRRFREAAMSCEPQNRWRHWAANCSISREMWEQTDGFNVAFRLGQDYEFGWRLHAAGADFIIDPELQVPHLDPAFDAQTRVPRAFLSGQTWQQFLGRHDVEVHDPESPKDVKARVWHLAVAVAAMGRSVRTYARLGVLVDRALPLVPQRWRFRLAALAVEAAGQAGGRLPTAP